MFKKLLDKLLAAKNPQEVEEILLCEVDQMFQKEKITWQDHERLFTLGGRLMKLAELMEKEGK